ncbi:hypothetical protein Taro_007731 [Colocasia esculenta]|uniref:Uncharacterized protein n=1 Tax=Colocasia esculenta TaxID=4460 RepID=A0A843U0G1_COLES|nr:hypothetical protein [Colocasia esculenta]
MTFLSVIRCPSLHVSYSLVVPSARGRCWSGLVQTYASGGFRTVFSRFRCPVLGCQSVVAPASVVSRPCGVLSVASVVCPTLLVSAGVVRILLTLRIFRSVGGDANFGALAVVQEVGSLQMIYA